MKRGVLGFWGMMMLVIAGLYWWRHTAMRPSTDSASTYLFQKAGTRSAPRKVADFSLVATSGQTVTPRDLEGKVWVASFFFANCPGVCIKQNQAVSGLQRELADPGLRFVSITVDPEHDTPERLREYAGRFEADPARWLFLTGPMNEIRRIANESFQVAAGPAEHSDRLFLVDRQGTIRGSFHGSQEQEVRMLKQKATELLKEPS